jgi:hypothetical protein
MADGHFGFTLNLPTQFRDGRKHTVRVRFAGTDVDLANSPGEFLAPGVATPKPATTLEGHLEVAGPDRVIGWAWDPSKPNVPLAVEVMADGKLLAKVTADTPREDLAAAGKGNGRHGFFLSTASLLRDGRKHSFLVRFGGTEVNLTGPK